MSMQIREMRRCPVVEAGTSKSVRQEEKEERALDNWDEVVREAAGLGSGKPLEGNKGWISVSRGLRGKWNPLGSTSMETETKW